MTSVAEHTGPAQYSVDDQIRALLARGFRFVDPRDDGGDVVALVGVRAHHNVIDVVRYRPSEVRMYS